MPQVSQANAHFRRVLFRSVFYPLVLMVVLSAVLVWQIGRLVSSTRIIEQADQVIAQLNRLEKLHIDMESGVRGFLIANDTMFLEPYSKAIAILDQEYSATREMILDRPEQLADLAKMREITGRWREFATDVMRSRAEGGTDWTTSVKGGVGKARMDEIRQLFAGMLRREESVRTERSIAAERSARLSVAIACGAAAIIGLGMALLARVQLRDLAKAYEHALNEQRAMAATLEARVVERTQALTKATERLTEANQELEAFAYSISHDLRAPLRHITGFSDLMLMSTKGQLSTDDAENLETINNTAKLAGRMVDDLLAFSRVGRTQLRNAPIDMNDLVRRSLNELSPELAKREVDWTIGDLPPASGDSALIKLVWQNLLSNAVKYSGKKDRAKIEVGSKSLDGKVTYFVKDDGVGFDMAYVHKLFGVFQRLHHSDEFEGTGIGLANVRRIISRHGGTVWAEGTLNQGATFYFTLPEQPIGN